MLKYLGLLLSFILILPILAQESTPEVDSITDNNAPINLGVSDVNAYLETDVIETTLGNPIPVTLKVEMPVGYSLPEWQPDTWFEVFQVIDTGEIVTRQQGNLEIQEQELSIVAWELDVITTGEVFLTYQNPSGQQLRTPITSITINVTATRPENDVTLRPLTPFIDLYYIPIYVFFIPIAIFIIAIIIIRNIRLNQRVQHALATPNSPVQKAIIELKHLIDANAPIEDVYLSASTEIRIYLTAQFNIRAIDMTTSELLTSLKSNEIFSMTLCNNLHQLLQEADLVKFANHRPLVSPEQVVNYAIHWIEQAERARISHD